MVITKNWGAICLFNLFVSSIVGVLMRYKIIYPLPALDQGNLLHAHSHFVFQGWMTLVLFCCLIAFVLSPEKRKSKVYSIQFWLMELSAVGMLISFFIQGYAITSIAFSTLSTFVFYWFAFCFLRDLRRSSVNTLVKYFSIAGILSSVISFIGPYALGYFSMSGSGSPILTRGAVYYYLHFQYNGWFFFASFALWLQWLFDKAPRISSRQLLWIFILMVSGLLPGYFLSLIGYYNSIIVHLFSFFAIITQVVAVVILTVFVLKNRKLLIFEMPVIGHLLWGIAFLSFVVKTILQIFSLHPSLAIVAFSLRPLVIGYLHLIFICLISFFIIGYLIYHAKLHFNSLAARLGLLAFIFFAVLNEVLLFLQAFGYYFIFHFPFIPKSLFWVTIGMSFALIVFFTSQLKRTSANLDAVRRNEGP